MCQRQAAPGARTVQRSSQGSIPPYVPPGECILQLFDGLKWDGIDADQREDIRRQLTLKLDFVPFAPLHFISARHGSGVGELVAAAARAFDAAMREMPTPALTKTLERAVKKASALPTREQNAFARWMLQELQAEARWQRAFSRTRGKLAAMAEKALTEHKAGRTRRLDPDRL